MFKRRNILIDRMNYQTYFLLILISAAIFLLAALSNQFFISNLNSDTLYLFETAKFLFSHKTLAGQNEPVAPYYFPDLMLLTTFNFLTANILMQHFLYGMMFLITYCVMVYQLIRLCFYEKNIALWGTLLALATSFLIIFPHFLFLEEWPASHLSVVIFSLFFINFYIRTLKKTLTIKTFIIFFGLIFAIFISDKIVFSQLLFPVSGLIVGDAITQKISVKKAVIWLGMFLLIIMLSLTLDKKLHYFAMSISYNGNLFRIHNVFMLHQTIIYQCQLLLAALKKNSLQYVLLLLYQIPSLFLFKKNLKFPHLSRVILFLWISQVSNLLLVLLAGKFNTLDHLRYLALFYFYPSILFALTILFLFKNKRYSKIILILNVLFIGCSMGIFCKINYPLLQTFNLQPLYPESVRCLDALTNTYSMHNGLAHYWYMRESRLFSRKHLQISQIDKWLNRVNYIDNKANFYEKNKKTLPLSYQFIIINELPKTSVIKKIGSPDKIVFCQHNEIWLYQASDHLARFNQAIVKKNIVQY